MPDFGVVDIAGAERSAIAANQAEQQGNLQKLQGERGLAVQQMQDLGSLAGSVTDQNTYNQFRGSISQIYPEVAEQMPDEYNPQEIESLKQQAAAFPKGGFTLGQGQERFTSGGTSIASVAPKPEKRGSINPLYSQASKIIVQQAGGVFSFNPQTGQYEITGLSKTALNDVTARIQRSHDYIDQNENPGTAALRAIQDSGVPVNKLGNVANLRDSSVGVPAPKSTAEYDKIPSGTKYKHPDGTMRTKP